jgi:hypothetical protein
MILRIDRWGTELPPPSDPDPAGAAAVQELMGGRFGEMSTLMNYTFQSFNFRDREGARPFYDLIANIAAEEYGHIELVAATINTMLTGASPKRNGKAPADALSGVKGIGNPHHFLAGGQGALPQDSRGNPWTGDYVFSSGDLVEDLTHNFFLETGARRGSRPTRSPSASRTSSAATTGASIGSRPRTTARSSPCSTASTPRQVRSSRSSTVRPRGLSPTICRRSRPCSRPTTHPRRSGRSPSA